MLYLRKKVRRKGSILVEYGLLMAGIVLTSVVGISVLGKKTADVIGVVAATLPGAHADDNHPIAAANLFPLTTDADGAFILDSSKLDSAAGVDRMVFLLGPNGGPALIIDK